MISLKSKHEIDLMREAGKRVAQILDELELMAAPGISTGELDKYAENRCKELDCIPAFKGYHGFPGSVCISVNEEAVHGIPSYKKILQSGDIVGLDFGVIYEGWFGDSAKTVAVGTISPDAEKLLKVSKESLNKGIEQCRAGNHISDIGAAIQKHAESFGYGVIRDLSGHGIGRALHEKPEVLNYGEPGQGIVLEVGMVLAIEPMINAGTHKIRIAQDGWTILTADSSLSAHFEHTVAITENGPEILTKR